MKKRKEKNDLRIERTLNSIKDSFKLLLSEKEYEKITIKELTEKAKINKTTFYRYYNHLEDLLDEIHEEISNNFIKRIENYRIPDDLDKINKEFFIFSEENDKIYEKILLKDNYEYIRNKMINKVMNKIWKPSNFLLNMPEEKRNIFLYYIRTVGLGIYKQWIIDKKKIPFEEIVEISNKILCDGIKIFTENKAN